MGDDNAGTNDKSQDDSEQPASGANDATETPATTPEGAKEKRTRKPRNPRALADGTGWRVPTPARIVEQRVAMVARAIIDGMGRSAILQATAKAQADEAKKRDAARMAALRAGVAKDDAELEARKNVPVLWGDEAPAERTIDLYIRRAKDAIGDEGKKLSRHREYVLGMQLARCNEVYSAAYKAGRYTVCVQIIREVNEMFGMHEAIKVLLLGNPDGDKVDTGDDQTRAMRTDDGRARMMSELMTKAAASDPQLAGVLGRFASIAASAKLSEVDPTTTSAPVATVAPPPPSKPSNGHKGNGHHGNGKH